MPSDVPETVVEKLDPSVEPQEQAGSTQELSKEEKNFISEMVALSLTGVVVRKGAVSVRMFSLGGTKTAVAYLLQESTDGYIVALPAVLYSNSAGEVSVDYIAPVPMVKFLKSGTPMIALPTPTMFYHYLKLTRERFGTLPGFFNTERKSQVDALIVQIKETFNVKEKLSFNGQSPSSEEPSATPTPNFLPEDTFFIDDSKTNKYRH